MPSPDPIDLVLPTAAETAMLRAALLPGAAGADAWTRWRREHGGAEALLAAPADGPKRLLPRLGAALATHGAVVPPAVATCLRTALVRERARWRAFADAAGAALDALDRAGVSHTVLRGLALADGAYDEPAERHCHDVDLWIEDAGAAGAALAAADFRPFRAPGRRMMVHESGLPVSLHTTLLDLPGWTLPEATMIARGETVDVLGRPSRVLAPDDALLHGLLHAAASWNRRTLVWAADAVVLLRRGAIDADRFRATAAASGAAPVVARQLAWLGTTFDLDVAALRPPVPARPSRLQRDAIVAAAAAGAPLSHLVASTRGAWRPAMLRWIVAPRPALLDWAHRFDPPRSRLARYLERPFRGIRRRTAGGVAGPGLSAPTVAAGRVAA